MRSEKILSDAIISALRSGFFLLRGLILIPIITKTAGPDVYGLWSTAVALVGILVTVGGFHLYGALIRYGQQDQDPKRTASEIYTLTLGTTSLIAVIYILLEFVLDLNLAGIGGDSSRIAFVLAGIAITQSGYTVLQNVPRALGQVKAYEFIQISRGLLEAIALGLVFYLTGSVYIGLIALLSTSVIMNALLGFKYYSGPELPSISSFKRYFSYGGPMFPREVASSIIQHADKVLILYFLSPTAVGIYAVVYSIAKLLQTMAGTLNSTLYPTVSTLWDNNDFDSLSKLYTQINRWSVLVGIPATAGLVFVSVPIIRLLSTSEIATASGEIIPVLVVGFALAGYAKPLVYILTSAEETTKIGSINVFAAVLNIGLNIVLIPRYGLLGAAIATLAAQAATAGYVTYRARTHIPISFSIRTFGTAVFGTIVMLGALVLFPTPAVPIVKAIAYPIVGVAVYFSLLVVLGETSKSELTKVIQMNR